ncbi:MAG: PucR family transcriptional regulator ligand-binding domain-containing protein [Clostridia bacterium]|nr:PucR family transcriptional regulator ligand-binding domain-containing protein [Clostridia bacterium]
MSVCVSDLMKLPSLRNATVIAGAGGLKRIVSSISVLEAADPGVLNDNLFRNDDFFGGEIVITGFLNLTDDVELQLTHLRRLAQGGEVGLILFYVGAFLKEVSPRLIQEADALDFALIKMPENRVDLRYSDVICEVMEAIIRDQTAAGSIAIEILERVAGLPARQRTIDTVARMVSDRIHVSVVLTDAKFNPLNEAMWPRAVAGPGYDIKNMRLDDTAPPYVYRYKIRTESIEGMELFLISDVNPVDSVFASQAAEVMQLAVSIWSDKHDHVVVSELVKAILRDEPVRMQRLARLFNIDVSSVDMMWIISGENIDRDLSDEVKNAAGGTGITLFSDIYEDNLVVFMEGPGQLTQLHYMLDALDAALDESCTITAFSNLKDTAAVRRAYLDNAEYIGDARRAFPGKRRFSGEDIAFVKQCRSMTRKGEIALGDALNQFNRLDQEQKLTVATYLLDAELSVSKTADVLFVHKNTVKYRLKCASDRIGFRVGDMPVSMRLSQAAAISRLMAGD